MSPNTKPHWLSDPELQQFFIAVKDAGGEARAVGGCVRDHFLRVAGGDVDLATTLAPEKIMALVAQKGWKAKPTGLAHGTVTVILPSRVMEVTTLRRDVETDGRHAKIAYTDRFEEDAARRDFTINAMYMGAAGKLYDFHGGEKDLAAKNLRFIGDADARVEEDGLRILRYFRFLATLGWQAEPAALGACNTHVPMMEGLSGERIQQEMKKLLAASDPTHALEQMVAIGLPKFLTHGAWNVPNLAVNILHARGDAVWCDWRNRLALLAGVASVPWVAERWKLSRKDTDWLELLRDTPPLKDVALVKEALRHHPREAVDRLLAYAVSSGVLDAAAHAALKATSAPPAFPVTAKDLLARGMEEGPALGKKLKEIEQRWVKSDYTLTKDQLLKS